MVKANFTIDAKQYFSFGAANMKNICKHACVMAGPFYEADAIRTATELLYEGNHFGSCGISSMEAWSPRPSCLPDRLFRHGRAQNAIISYLVEPSRQHMLKESGQEFHDRQGHGKPPAYPLFL